MDLATAQIVANEKTQKKRNTHEATNVKRSKKSTTFIYVPISTYEMNLANIEHRKWKQHCVFEPVITV